jgi:hypothetical protein
MPARIFYFGCVGQPGHYLWSENLRHVYEPHECPWRDFELDGKLCPKGIEHQGVAKLTYKEGWTALAFWDRTVDKRGGCNSAFLLNGTLTFEQACQTAKHLMPSIWNRFPYGIIADEPVTPLPLSNEERWKPVITNDIKAKALEWWGQVKPENRERASIHIFELYVSALSSINEMLIEKRDRNANRKDSNLQAD